MPRQADPVTRYAKAVVRGKLCTGVLVRLACKRHLADLETGKARGLRFDVTAANRAIRFFPTVCRHSKGEWAGKSMKLQPWQEFRIGSVFGWKRTDGTRRFRTAFHSMARKNGKSTEASGLGLLMQVADDEPGAEIFSYAGKKEQARIVFDEAKNMARRSPALSNRLEVHKLNIAMLSTGSKFEPLSSDIKTQDGLNIHCAIGDEIHAHRTREMYDVVETAMGSRRQPLHWLITTRGSDQHGICGEVEDYSEKVLTGEVEDDSWFAYIACLDEGDRWDDPKVWSKANPNLGVSVKLDRLLELATKARHAPAAQGEFKRKHCNIWTEASERWLDAEAWQACGGRFDLDDLLGQPCYGGLDLSGAKDLTAFVLLFPDIDGTDKLVCFFWLPDDGLEGRANADKAPYTLWKDAGFLHTTPGASIQKSFVAHEIARICAQFDVQAIGYDRWRMADMINELDAAGMDVDKASTDEEITELQENGILPLVSWGQGFRDMSPAVDEIEGAVLDRRLRHGDNPILTWCASNVVLSTDAAGNRKPDKKKAHQRIDGIVAAAMASGVRSRLVATKPEASPYAERGFLEL